MECYSKRLTETEYTSQRMNIGVIVTEVLNLLDPLLVYIQEIESHIQFEPL
jgi:hypothetical protein